MFSVELALNQLSVDINLLLNTIIIILLGVLIYVDIQRIHLLKITQVFKFLPGVPKTPVSKAIGFSLRAVFFWDTVYVS